MISGFVISYTLARTPSFRNFCLNRFSRLFPAMLFCSLLTYGGICLLDRPTTFPYGHELCNLLPGFTFVNPQLWWMLGGHQFHWINGSYWTLWTEVQFYLFASVIYYLNKRQFFRNLLLGGITMAWLKYLPGYFLNNYPDAAARTGLDGFLRNWRYADELFNLCFFIGWFLLGTLFWSLHEIGMTKLWRFFFALVLAGVTKDSFNYFPTIAWPLCAGLALFCGVFSWMIFRAPVSVPGSFFFRRIGIISYSMYLIHEEIGLLLINHFHHLLGGLSCLAPFLIIGLAAGFAELSYRWYERYLTKALRRWLSATL
ncbi:acyltransferase family protein [Mucilaginibacter jinjuensis]|uniref:Acyltransferase n=1 Tax=Mucilaginibacter jinjuensis TaxID=1176721 RepID=A0ABY7TA62_9SPHI|nr:acyltransferase [Mucilaginibacter jinjuensis]WCT13394.1 acyltransferase [Mucilaginibacter jinjuensis]